MKGLKYFAEYSDFDGQEYKIEIWVEGFTGVATMVTAGGNPVTIDKNKDVSETYLGGIVPTFYHFEFVTDTNFSTRVFDSEKYGDVVIQHYKGTNLQFNAIVQPFVGMEQDLPDGLSVFTLSGECGLEYLKNKKFANPSDTNVRLIDLVQEAVDLIPYVEKFGFKVFDNTALYNGVSRINSNQNFLEARINRKTFTDYTYYDVLLNLVANRNEIYFDNGYWWVRNLSELSELYTTSNTGRLVTYDENGDFLTSIPNYRPSKSIIRQAGGSFGKLFSQKNIVVKRIEPERINYVLNGSFDQGSTNFVPNNWTAGSEAFSSVLGADFFRFVESVYTPTLTSDNAYIQSTAITWEPFGALFASPVREPQKLTFRANVEIGTGISACRFQIIATIGGSPFYLTSDLAWTTTPTVMQKKPDASGKIEFDIPQPPNQGFTNLNNFNVPIIYNVSMRLFRSERAFETAVSTATYFTQYNEVSFFKDSLYTQFFDEYIGKSDYRQDENSDRENPLELETIIASQNSFPYRHGSLFDASGVAANGFGSVNSVAGSIYNIYLATSYLNVTSKRLTYYQGSSFEHFDFSDVLLIDGIHFRVSNYSHDIKSKTVQFKAVELNYSSGFVLDTNKIKSDVEKAITVVNNIGVIPQDYNFTSSTNFDGRTSFGMRPDVRHVSASLTEMFLRAEPSAADSVSIKPGATGIELLTPPPLATTPETLATREWAANGLETKYLQLDTTYTNGNFPGRLSWDADHDLMFLGLENDYTAKVPQDSVWSCIAAEAITKGELVYASGTVGSSGKIQASRFIANGTIPSRFVIGVATRTVAQGETFHALRAGVLRGLDTSVYTAGQDLWASSTVAGGFQTTAPTAPNPKMSVAFVITSHANVGELAIRVAPSVSLGLIDDVQVTSPTNGQVLTYDGNKWINSTSVNVLTDKQFTDVASGLRLIRSIDYYESRMDFGFDKVLDVPYLYYDKNNTRYVNYMNGDGVFVHVDSIGNEREYLRVGDIASEVPNLQQVSEVGRSSSVRLQWNGIDYAVGTPTLQDVSQQGSNSSIRLKFNGQDYATLQDLIGITAPPTPNLQQVSQQGANSTIRLQLNGVGYATLNDLPAAGVTPNLQQVSQVGANSTIRLQFNGVNYATVNDINTGGTIPTLSTVLTAGNNAFGTPILFGSSYIRAIDDKLFLVSQNETSAIIISPLSINVGSAAGANLNVNRGLGTMVFTTQLTGFSWDNGIVRNYAFHNTPSTLSAGAKYVFQWDGSKFIIVNA